MLNNVIKMTKAEQKVTIKVSSDSVNSFTEENRKTYDSIRSKAAFPKIFGSHAPNWLRSIGALLINVKDIITDNKYYEQIARENVNPKEPNIREDTTLNGFCLAELGIIVAKSPIKGKWIIVEGRTRFKILVELGMTNIIAEAFEEMSVSNMMRFAGFMNSSKKPYGEASIGDMKKIMLALIQSGEIAPQPNTVIGRTALTDTIRYELEFIGASKLKPSEVDLLVYEGIEKATGVKSVISFPNGKGAQEKLEELLGKERITQDLARGIKYVVAAAFDEKMYGRFITEVNKADRTIKEIRMVMHIGVPKSNDPEGSWIKDGAGFKKRFNIFENNISDIRFNGVRIDDSKIKIYGAIPQVRSLDSKYPMNKIYVYNN
tara:strand:+ start:560 stop:1684 length:1125 start_codon:yes stop_codon:yes gene_type:complete